MRVGISVTPLYYLNGQPKKFDGIGAYTAEICQALQKQNVSVQELYFKKLKEICTDKVSSAPHFHVAHSPLCSLLPGIFYNNINNKIDILHITDHLVPRTKNLPTIATIHDAIMLKHPEWTNDSRCRFHLKKFILKKLAKQADHFITVSSACVGDIVNYWGIPEHKISVIHHGLSADWRQPLNPSILQATLNKYQLTKPFFLTVGTLQPRKNIDNIINAYLSLPKTVTDNFDLVIVGKAHPTLTPPPLLAKINGLSAAGKLFWLKYVPFTDLRGLYQNAYALLYPSLAEGFGFPVLEGFASATPVITSNFGSTAEISGTAAYLIDPYSQDAIAAALQELTDKPALREQLIQRGLSQVAAFTWEQCALQTIKVYKKYV